MSEYNLEKLEAYLLNSLPTNERAEMEAEMKENSELREELEALKLTRQAIKMDGWKRTVSQVQDEFLSSRKSERASKQPRPIGATQLLLRIAASVVLVLAGSAMVVYFITTPEALAEKHNLTYSVPVMRTTDTLSSIEEAYRNGEFERVIALSQTPQPDQPIADFLGAMALLESGKVDSAITRMLEIQSGNRETGNSRFADELDYFLVKAYLQAQNYDQAGSVVHKIRADSGHTYYRNFTRSDLLKIKILKLKK